MGHCRCVLLIGLYLVDQILEAGGGADSVPQVGPQSFPVHCGPEAQSTTARLPVLTGEALLDETVKLFPNGSLALSLGFDGPIGIRSTI